ncbi:MAG TPA: hypothetical protein ENK74_00475 [Nitratifractor sp.]|nr:hypothetical protein [Nitratifractor sp.]
MAKAAIEKLDYLYDFYCAKVDEKMNRNVYYLTLLSGIFLPLTLATGFFGMNTSGLPYTNDPSGTLENCSSFDNIRATLFCAVYSYE